MAESAGTVSVACGDVVLRVHTRQRGQPHLNPMTEIPLTPPVEPTLKSKSQKEFCKVHVSRGATMVSREHTLKEGTCPGFCFTEKETDSRARKSGDQG